MDYSDIDTISVPNPDDTMGMPLYDGDIEAVNTTLSDGVYENVVAAHEEDGDLIETVGTLFIEAGFVRFEG